MADRSCSSCRKYCYDETTGEVMRDRAGLPVLRNEALKPPCEKPHIGCAKGHWRKPIELTAGDRRLIELYEASVATGGAVLTERERNDDIIAFAFSLLSVHYDSARTASLVASLGSVIASLRK